MPVEDTAPDAGEITVAIIHHAGATISHIEVLPAGGQAHRADLDASTAATLSRLIQTTRKQEAMQ